MVYSCLDTWISPFTVAVGKVFPDGERNDYGGERRVALGWSLGALTTPARRVLTNQRRDFEKKEKRVRALALCFRWARPLWEAAGQRSGRRSTLQEIAQKILKKGFIQVCTAWQNECNHLYRHTSYDVGVLMYSLKLKDKYGSFYIFRLWSNFDLHKKSWIWGKNWIMQPHIAMEKLFPILITSFVLVLFPPSLCIYHC